VGLVFWTVDIVLNFNTAVYIQGQLVTKRRRILRRYLSTWFALDISSSGDNTVRWLLCFLNNVVDPRKNLEPENEFHPFVCVVFFWDVRSPKKKLSFIYVSVSTFQKIGCSTPF
jgi:hypothetical protein